MTREIFHGIPRESVASLVYILLEHVAYEKFLFSKDWLFGKIQTYGLIYSDDFLSGRIWYFE